MIVQNAYNRKSSEYFKIDDLHEDNIKIGKINSTSLERHLARVNVGAKRRVNNNHAERLAQYKARLI